MTPTASALSADMRSVGLKTRRRIPLIVVSVAAFAASAAAAQIQGCSRARLLVASGLVRGKDCAFAPTRYLLT